MKVTQSQLLELLAKLGVQNAEIVETETDSEFDMSATLNTVDATRTPIIKQKVEGELTDSITTAKQGELNGMFKKMLAKTFGVSRSQLDKFDTMDEAVEFAKNTYSEQFEGDKSEMEKKYNELVANFNTEKEKVVTEWQTKYNQLQDEHLTAKQIEVLHERLKEAPITWDKMVAAKEMLSYAKGKYDVKIEDGVVKYYEKGTNRLALNKAGNEELKDVDIAREYLEPRNGWAKDTRHEKPSEIQKPHVPKQEVNPYLDKGQGDKLAASWQIVEQLRKEEA